MPKTMTDLFRRGNANGPRLSHVRLGKDIIPFQINRIDWVAAHAGGVSTFSTQGAGANWWVLPAGNDYPDELAVVNDHDDHFNWEPNVEMTLDEYMELLRDMEAAFQRVS